jgi:2-polyprenyl-6-methoxyphenol hydroxylase-like FAD-dependent oxidoreductase
VSDRPVVLGCGIAGIAAAAALRESFGEVLVVERDVLPEDAIARSGVPQGPQLHNLLSRAQIHLERLLPGFCDALREAGAGDACVSVDTHVFELGQRMPERNLGMRLMCAPRPVIETVARKLLLAAGGVSIHDGALVARLELDDSGAAAGVTIKRHRHTERIAARIVVDATGSRSAAPRWLRSLGRGVPHTDTARVRQWYVSAVFERPQDRRGSQEFWLVFPTPPKTRGGLVSPVGPDRGYVSLSGRADDEPPRSSEEMRAYAATLEAPWIADLLADASAVTEPHLFRRLNARWRRYDLLADPVAGFLPLGDSIATLNPLLGQGMSVAAWQASALADLVNAGRSGAELTSAYLAEAAEACRAAWTLAGLVEPGTAATETPYLLGDRKSVV